MQHFLVVTVVGLLSFRAFGNEDVGFSECPSREISVSDLPQLIATEKGIQELYEEFKSIEGGQRRPWTVATLPENIKKNRYENELLAFDHSRVVLDLLPGDPHSDYINANYIDGQNSEKEYVATQGPLPNTVNDFWRMIWQLNTTKIVMLANITEHGQAKVEKYWPEISSTYGDIEVTTIKEYPIPQLQHVVRTFAIKKKESIIPRIVRHFQFTGWPDLGVPDKRFPVVAIINRARIYDQDNKAPIVVHCSAGIGRTGTVILMDSMIQRANAKGVVDFPKRLDHMRTLRPDMVERKEQYLFAHQGVIEVFNDPQTPLKLSGVEQLYRPIDQRLDIEDFAPPKDLSHALRRMRWQNSVMKMLINNMERTLLNRTELVHEMTEFVE